MQVLTIVAFAAVARAGIAPLASPIAPLAYSTAITHPTFAAAPAAHLAYAAPAAHISYAAPAPAPLFRAAYAAPAAPFTYAAPAAPIAYAAPKVAAAPLAYAAPVAKTVVAEEYDPNPQYSFG